MRVEGVDVPSFKARLLDASDDYFSLCELDALKDLVVDLHSFCGFHFCEVAASCVEIVSVELEFILIAVRGAVTTADFANVLVQWSDVLLVDHQR